jgi:hypothetical protein
MDDKIIGSVFVGAGIIVIALIGLLIYETVFSKHITLISSNWSCTKQQSHIVMIGKMLDSQNRCTQYTRK